MFFYLLKTDQNPTDFPNRVELINDFGLSYIPLTKFNAKQDQFKGSVVFGVFPTYHKEKVKPQLHPESQTIYEFDRYYIGWWNVDTTPPVNLFEKEKMLTPMPYFSEAGDIWNLPVIPVSLPNRFALDEAGNPYRAIAKDFLGYLSLVEKYFDIEANLDAFRKKAEEAATDDEKLAIWDKIQEMTPSDKELFTDVETIVQLNYHVSMKEMGLMEWFSYADLWRILRSSLQLSPPDAPVKKKSSVQ